MPRGVHNNHQPGNKFDPECTELELAILIREWCDDGKLVRENFLKKGKRKGLFMFKWCTAIAKEKGWSINTRCAYDFIQEAVTIFENSFNPADDGPSSSHVDDTERVTKKSKAEHGNDQSTTAGKKRRKKAALGRNETGQNAKQTINLKEWEDDPNSFYQCMKGAVELPSDPHSDDAVSSTFSANP